MLTQKEFMLARMEVETNVRSMLTVFVADVDAIGTTLAVNALECMMHGPRLRFLHPEEKKLQKQVHRDLKRRRSRRTKDPRDEMIALHELKNHWTMRYGGEDPKLKVAGLPTKYILANG